MDGADADKELLEWNWQRSVQWGQTYEATRVNPRRKRWRWALGGYSQVSSSTWSEIVTNEAAPFPVSEQRKLTGEEKGMGGTK